MAHPAKPEESCQNHRATKDHSWNSKSSMWWSAAITTVPARAWRGQKTHFKWITCRTDYSLLPTTTRDWNNLSLSPDQDPPLPLTAQDLPWESGSSIIQVCPWQISQQLEVVAHNGHPSIWWPRSIVLIFGFPEKDIGLLCASEWLTLLQLNIYNALRCNAQNRQYRTCKLSV